jgi:hypothetical protein
MVYTYPLSGYGKMIADRGRTEDYQQALRQVITPESVWWTSAPAGRPRGDNPSDQYGS